MNPTATHLARRRPHLSAHCRVRWALPLLLPALALSGLVAGCGTETPPGESVPALAQRLDRVDAAIEAGNYRQARSAVEALVLEATRAEAADELSADQADRIRRAAQEVLARLPANEPTEESPSAPATSNSPPDESEPASEDDDDDKDKDKEEKKDKEEDD